MCYSKMYPTIPRNPSILCLFLSMLSVSVLSERPILTQVLFRHGERAPIHYLYFPTDPPEIQKQFPVELGELTDNGINQAYQFGQHLKSMYGDLLSANYTPSELRILAGEDNRTIDTAMAALAALLPPKSQQQNWNPNLNWRPVPVHTDELLDWSGYDSLDKCSTFNDAVVASKPYSDMMTKYGDMIQYLEAKTGLYIGGIRNLDKILDTLKTRKRLGLPMPQWDNGTWYDTAVRVATDITKIYSEDPWAQEFTGGWLFLQLVSAIEYRIQNNVNHRLILYSGHDNNLVPLGRMLGVSAIASSAPDFLAYLSIELYNNTGGYEVKLRFSEKTGQTARYVQMDACPSPCSFDSFRTLAPTLSTREAYEYCYDFNTFHTIRRFVGAGDRTLIVILAVITTALLVLLVITCCLSCSYRQQVQNLKDSERKRLTNGPQPTRYL